MPNAITHKMKRSRREKLARLRDSGSLRVLDLFAGCGGISLGCQLAGCEVIAGVELDPAAARSHALNFHSDISDASLRERHALSRDITKQGAAELIKELRPAIRRPHAEVDVLVGGPPCQAFARVGRAKLREINEHPEAFLYDERSGLYRHYIRFVEELMPVAVIIENVPDVLNYGGLNIFELIAGALDELGYECRYGLLNAAHYGVPQMRTRCFLVGVAREADVIPGLPEPSHKHDLPSGYRGTRDVATKHRNLWETAHFVDTPSPEAKLEPAYSAQEALHDLPRLTSHLKGELKKAPRRLNEPIKLPSVDALGAYSGLMRNWPGFEGDGYVYDHAIRFLPRDYKIFKAMKPGDQYPDAHALATRMFSRALARIETERGTPLSKSSKRYKELLAYYIPPYDPSKFPNKWRKMEADAPTRTLMAHIGKDTYSHIHYDSRQARTISVREAARLQSFPDGFRFFRYYESGLPGKLETQSLPCWHTQWCHNCSAI